MALICPAESAIRLTRGITERKSVASTASNRPRREKHLSIAFMPAIRTVLARDLRALAREVEAYPADALAWELLPGTANSAGTLVLHLVGNLEHFVGAVLGQTGFVRDREAEFATRGLTRADLLARIETAAKSVDATLERITPERCDAPYPAPVGNRTLRTADFLLHLATHLNYHLGQIDYHRRALVPDAGTVDAVPLAELSEHQPSAR